MEKNRLPKDQSLEELRLLEAPPSLSSNFGDSVIGTSPARQMHSKTPFRNGASIKDLLVRYY